MKEKKFFFTGNLQDFIIYRKFTGKLQYSSIFYRKLTGFHNLQEIYGKVTVFFDILQETYRKVTVLLEYCYSIVVLLKILGI